jgi:hypothetical protein
VTNPTTKSGRALLEHVDLAELSYGRTGEPILVAIEREARAALLDELEAAVRGLPTYTSDGGATAQAVHRFLALIQKHREEGT